MFTFSSSGVSIYCLIHSHIQIFHEYQLGILPVVPASVEPVSVGPISVPVGEMYNLSSAYIQQSVCDLHVVRHSNMKSIQNRSTVTNSTIEPHCILLPFASPRRTC